MDDSSQDNSVSFVQETKVTPNFGKAEADNEGHDGSSFESISVTREEVEIAMKQMEPITALGPDGMPSLFYQSFWTTVGDDVCSAVLDFLHNCKILKN